MATEDVLEMDYLHTVDKFKKVKRVKKWFLKPTAFAIALALLLVLSVICNICYAFSKPSETIIESSNKLDYYPFSIKYPTNTPTEANITCSKCPSWIPALLRLNHLLLLQNQTDLYPVNKGKRNPTIECNGTVELFPEFGIIKLSRKTHLSSSPVETHPVRFEAFVSSADRRAKAEIIGMYSYSNGYPDFEDELTKYLSQFFATFRELLNLESLTIYGGSRPGHSDWSELVISFEGTLNTWIMEHTLESINEEIRKRCHCSEIERKMKELNIPYSINLNKGCGASVNPALSPILELLGNACSSENSTDASVQQ